MQRTFLQLPRRLSPRAFSTQIPRHSAPSPFKHTPSPPRLPKEEQEIFERLQQESTGAFSIPLPQKQQQQNPQINQSPDSSSPSKFQINQSPDSDTGIRLDGEIRSGEGQELHPNVRRGALPEFEGDVNPKTGEVGGPKNEPLRWGHAGDWSYNGRVTDF